MEKLDKTYCVSSVTGDPISIIGMKSVEMKLGDLVLNHKVLVTGDIPSRMLLLGNDILGGNVWGINFKRGILYIENSSEVLAYYKGHGSNNGTINDDVISKVDTVWLCKSTRASEVTSPRGSQL